MPVRHGYTYVSCRFWKCKPSWQKKNSDTWWWLTKTNSGQLKHFEWDCLQTQFCAQTSAALPSDQTYLQNTLPFVHVVSNTNTMIDVPFSSGCTVSSLSPRTRKENGAYQKGLGRSFRTARPNCEPIHTRTPFYLPHKCRARQLTAVEL